MKITCINSSVKQYGNYLKMGSEHIVYGMELYNDELQYLITNGGEWPFWYPSELFRITDSLVYTEWHVSVSEHQGKLNVIWGYKELLDPTHYQNLLERELEDMRIFEKRKQEIDEYEALSSYIPKKTKDLQPHELLKSNFYSEPIDQRICPDTLEVFLEKYLKGQILIQTFKQLYLTYYVPEIRYVKLTPQEEVIMKEFYTVVENYAPDQISPNRVYTSEDEVKVATKKTLTCVQANPSLSSLMSER